MPAREYRVLLGPVAKEAFDALPQHDRQLVFDQLKKLKRAPELGSPLGNMMGYRLTGYRKLYAAKKRIRIIYTVIEQKLVVEVIAIGPREGAQVYAVAAAEAKKRRLRRIV
jgi:mRNA-degrading endonuclease RelE of RelBE toxin-antitoxin system